MVLNFFEFLSGPAWHNALAFVMSCNWHMYVYAALGCSLLMRAYLAYCEQRPDQAREQACDCLLHFVLALLAGGH